MKYITAKEIKKLMDTNQKFVLLDCRSQASYDVEHIAQAQNILWSEVPNIALAAIPDKKTMLITSCSSITCDASLKCYEELAKLGYTNIYEYPGGLAEWITQGYPTQKNKEIRSVKT